jgi:hypothetical protein
LLTDLHLKDAIPHIELSLRSHPHSATKISIFESVMGRKICLPIIANEPVNTKVNFTGDQIDYYNFVSQRLQEIYDGVRQEKLGFTPHYSKECLRVSDKTFR